MSSKLLVFVAAITLIFSLNTTVVFAADTLNINGIIKKGTFFGTNMYVQNSDMNFTFGDVSSLCPNNSCHYEFEDGDFSESLFGGDKDRVFSGVLKIEDKENSEGNFTSYINYKISAVFHLVNTKENKQTGEQLDTYKGNLGFDTEDAIFTPQYQYASIATHDHSTGKFELNGNITN